MKHLLIRITLSTVALCGASFAAENPVKSAAPGKAYVYKTSGGKERQMEIFFPPNHDPAKSKVPGIIFFHGGAWLGGSLGEFRSTCAYFASRGLVCATANYQMLKISKAEAGGLPAGRSQIKPVCVTDAKSAIRWFKQHAGELGIDPNRIITGGTSAGGHISALATMSPHLDDPADPKGIDTSVVGYIWVNPAFSEGDHKTPEIDLMRHMKAQMPPSIVYFGEKDGWKKGWDAAHAKWKSLGTETINLQIAPGENHGFWNHSPEWQTVMLIETDKFLVKHGFVTGEPTLTMPESGEKFIDPTDAGERLEQKEDTPGSGKMIEGSAAHATMDEPKPNPADKAAFKKAVAGAAWAEVFSDDGTENWQEKWFLDGEVGTVTNSPEGMTLTAGPEFKNDAHHMVLWTKDSFTGDLKIEYDYTRLDEAPNCVTILYIQATGSGEGPYAKDITKWSELRKVPAMKTYYNHMNTYHISYAVGDKKYIRGRRYMPEKQGLKGTELKPDYFTPELFATGVKHHITVIKKDRDLYMRVENRDRVVYCHMNNPDLPAITEGRIGLRHMFTRSARYANFRVSQPAAPAPAETAAGLSDAELLQLRETAASRRRAAFESESGKPFVSRDIRVDWNDRGDFTRHYIQDTIAFATRALHLNEQIDEANVALRTMCQYHLDRPQTLLEIHSFPNAPRFLARLSLLYGPDGSRTKGLISEETHAVILKTLWTWCQSKLKIADTAIEPWHTWTGHSSENHDANHFASCWAATLLLSREPAYRDLIADQHTVKEHYAAWTAWVTEYLRQRGRKGMTVEIDSASYSQATLAAIYLIHDLAEEPELRQLASYYMTLAWALWAEQQIQGVNGGAKTRHYPTSAKAAGNPLSGAAWYVLGSEDLPKPNGPPPSAFLTSTWQIPDVVMDIAFDVSGRGTYEAIQRKPGLRPAEEIEPLYKIHLAPDAPALVRYTYATPDFIMGSLFCDALPGEAWNSVSSQNRWHGAIFAGDRNARIYPYGETVKSHYNAHWAVQKRGTLIAQKLKTSKNVTQHRVWFSREGLSEPIQEGAWYFAEADSAYAAVRVASGEAAFEDEATDQRARILTCADDLSPVILEVARKADFPDFKTFREAVQALPFAFDGTVLTYTGLSRDRFTFFADQSERPQINGEPIDLGPEKVYDSPFVQSDWDSGVVTIQFGDKKQILDFNEAPNP